MAIEAEALRDALRLALKFVDRSAGEGIFFEANGDTPAMDAAEVCIAVSEALGIDFAGPEYGAFVDGGPLPDLIHRSKISEETALAGEDRATIEEAKSGLMAWSGGQYGACRDTIIKLDRMLAALPLIEETAHVER